VPLIGVPLIGVPLECLIGVRLTECASHGLISHGRAPHGRVPHWYVRYGHAPHWKIHVRNPNFRRAALSTAVVCLAHREYNSSFTTEPALNALSHSRFPYNQLALTLLV
jgi:hypothetical protein